MHFIKGFHVGQRAAKTAIAVGLSLLVTQWMGSSLPIFAAIGAISVMSRTWSDSIRESVMQFAGTLVGYLVACLFVLYLPWPPQFFLWMGIGTFLVIALCIALRLHFAIPLACIVFADVCLYTGENAVVYGFHRFTDTIVGLVVALLVNLVIRPYNNRGKIKKLMEKIQKMVVPLLGGRVLEHRYPDLSELRAEMNLLSAELKIFEQQPPITLRRRAMHLTARRQEAAYLRGCEQLLQKMVGELEALCNMDANPIPGEMSQKRLAAQGLYLSKELQSYVRCCETDTVVLDYHIANFLDAYDFLSAFRLQDKAA